MLNRRGLLRSAAASGVGLVAAGLLPAWARGQTHDHHAHESGGPPEAPASSDLRIARTPFRVEGREGVATTINGGVPGPLLRWREGQEVTLAVSNALDKTTSLHWHGLLVPYRMDGVPGVSFPGIAPGETFVYRFPIRQRGTYWYHSHSAFQEQSGVYGPIIIDPAGGERVPADREHIVVLSDWTFESPERVYANLKREPHYYNYQRRTLGDLLRDASREGWGPALSERAMWGRMRMSPTDIADVTGATYRYLVNGLGPEANWTALYRPGERVRLRIINASAMTYFDVRIPGLPMTVISADGVDVEPVETDEIRIAVAETYDVIVAPPDDRAYTIFAESMDRSGYARGTLAVREGLAGEIPPRRARPVRSMADMGHGESAAHAHEEASPEPAGGAAAGHDHSAHGSAEANAPEREPASQDSHAGHDMAAAELAGGEHAGHGAASGEAGADRAAPAGHAPATAAAAPPRRVDPVRAGPGVDMRAASPVERLDDPGVGLGQDGWRVLTYAQLRGVADLPDARPPAREIELHLTSNMERYMWSFDGVRFSEAPGPIEAAYGERLRLVLINDTMMEHPIHLHGMFVELDNGAGARRPLKHTVNVKPGERVVLLLSADEPGDWAWHCHLLYHMEAGMMRVLRVSGPEERA